MRAARSVGAMKVAMMCQPTGPLALAKVPTAGASQGSKTPFSGGLEFVVLRCTAQVQDERGLNACAEVTWQSAQ